MTARTGAHFSAKVHRAVESFLRENMAPIPVPFGEKNPNRSGWPTENWSIEDIPRQWSHGENIGLLLGKPSNGLCDVDLDWSEAVDVAQYLLPDTSTSGRPGRLKSHRWYRADPIPKTKAFRLPGRGDDLCVVELRSTGSQTLVPPSLHPSGERYIWSQEKEITEIDGAELFERVSDVATAALLVRNYPGRGSRHDYVLASAGMLGRHLEPERVKRIMRAVVGAAGDEEAEDRARDVRDTLEKIRTGLPSTGAPTLENLAPGVPGRLCHWHGWTSAKNTQLSSVGSSLLTKRVPLAGAIEMGIPTPEELEPHVLLKGRVHQIYAPAGMGKSWVAIWLTVRCIERGERVLFLDMENGIRIIAERLGAMDAHTSTLDDLLYYIPSPGLTTTASALAEYVELLDTFKPVLIVFDSWINFLAAAQLDENAAGDIASWAIAYTHPARDRGITVVLLDHVSHSATHARGSTRKKDEVDVQFRLSLTRPFNRDRVGEIELSCEKDREGWLPDSIRFEVGGDESGFVFRRREGASEQNGEVSLTKSQQKALEALRSFGEQGAGFNAWRGAAEVAKETLSKAAKKLVSIGFVLKGEDGRYRVPAEIASKGSRGLPNHNRTEPNSGEEVRSGSPPLGGEPTAPPHDPDEQPSNDNNVRERA